MSARMAVCKLRRDEQGFSMIAALIYLFVILVLCSCLMEQVVQELNIATRAKKSTAAFHLAEAGIDYGAWQLYNNQNVLGTWTDTIPNVGSYSVTASQYNGSASTIQLLSTATYQGQTSQVKVIGAYLGTGGDTENTIFGNAVFSNANASFNGGMTVTGNIFCNGNLSLNGGATITGNAGAAGNLTVNGGATVGGTKLKNQPKVTMPVIDVAHYKSEPGAVILQSGPIPSTINGVVYINGPLSCNGGITISGKGVIVVNGDVSINGGATIKLADGNSEFAIITTGSVKFNGGATIQGWIYAHNVSNSADFSGNGGATITGGVVADAVSANGGLTVSYKAATVEMPGAQAAPAQFASVAWRQVQ